MKLDIDFSLLEKAVVKMGASNIRIQLTDDIIIPIDPIDKQLGEGFEVDLIDINFDTGLASYQGRQVLLYIKDHSYNNKIYSVIKDGSLGNRYHIANCSKLDEMRKKGRFDRYVVTNKVDGAFRVSGRDNQSDQLIEGDTRLHVCQYCLESINYKRFASLSRGSARREFVSNFDLIEFFDTYSSFFHFMPSGIAEKLSDIYSDDWPIISKNIRKQYHFKCQECGVNLNQDTSLLHVHHINGVKSDNREKNLKPLCCDCHRKEPNHGHMFVSHEKTQRLNRLRREQALQRTENWEDVYSLADPGMHGVIDILTRYQISLPEVGGDVQDQKGKVVAELELAWPHQKVGVAVDKEDAVAATKCGWKVYSMRHALSKVNELVSKIL